MADLLTAHAVRHLMVNSDVKHGHDKPTSSCSEGDVSDGAKHLNKQISADFRRKAVLWILAAFLLPMVGGSLFAIAVFNLIGSYTSIEAGMSVRLSVF